MNYDEARELPTGGWHWTSMNDGVIRTCPPCISFREPFDHDNPMKPVAPENIVRCEPHATKEDAERHFYDSCLATLRESTWTAARKCERGCGTWADKSLGDPGMGGYFSDVFLCDFHRNAESVAELRPFKPDIQVVHS